LQLIVRFSVNLIAYEKLNAMFFVFDSGSTSASVENPTCKRILNKDFTLAKVIQNLDANNAY